MSDDPRALTMHQPWASLVAVGAKTIETRSWSTSYRGPLLIHAGKARPKGWWSNLWRDDYYERASEIARAAVEARPVEFEIDGPLWSAEESTNGEDWYHRWRGPLGAVVASCQLIDCVPIHALSGPCGAPTCIVKADGLWLYRSADAHKVAPEPHGIHDQLPFGDFSPGRYAWLLDDIKPVDPPVPMRGRRGLWRAALAPVPHEGDD